MGSFIPKRKVHLTNEQIIQLLKDINEQIICDMLENPNLLNKYKMRHLSQLIRLYQRPLE